MILMISAGNGKCVLISASSVELSEQTKARACRAFARSFNKKVLPEQLVLEDYLDYRVNKWNKCSPVPREIVMH